MLVFAALISLSAIGQEPRSSLTMFSHATYNPGYAGTSGNGDAYIGYRSQYMGLEDENGNSLSPITYWGAITMPMKKIKSGVGFSIVRDEIGFITSNDVQLSYTYHLKAGEGLLGLGLSVGVYNFGFKIEDEVYPGNATSDPLIDDIKKNNDNITRFNAGLGAFYYSKKLYFGVSSRNITQPKLELTSNSNSDDSYLLRHYYVTAGYMYQTSNPAVVLKPSVFGKTTGKSATQLNLDFVVEYNKFIVGGVSYTTGNELTGLLGFKVSNGSKFDGVRAIVSFDLPLTSKMKEYSSTNFEFQLGYSFNLSVEKSVKTYKSVRFL